MCRIGLVIGQIGQNPLPILRQIGVEGGMGGVDAATWASRHQGHQFAILSEWRAGVAVAGRKGGRIGAQVRLVHFENVAPQ